jgi:hypothetical protein
MKRFKKFVMAFTVLAIVGAGSAVYASAAMTPAEIAASLTGKSVQALNQERAAGKTYGTIAKEANKLDEFKSQMLEQKKLVLDQRVAEGRLTQERADTIYNSIKTNQANCDGTGNAKMGKNAGAGFGQGNGMGKGLRDGSGAGANRGAGFGLGQCQNR